MTLTVVLVLAGFTVLLKGAASMLRSVPEGLQARLAGLAPALLAALVVSELLDPDGVPMPDEKMAGVAVAVILATRHAPFALCVLGGAATAALLRAV